MAPPTPTRRPGLRRRPGACLALAAALAVAADARADVVHLTNGRQIAGFVEAEDDGQVVVTTGGGRITLDRRQVARIEREPPGRTWLGLARAARAAGDLEQARRSYEKAIAAGDREGATARTELEALLGASRAEEAPRGERVVAWSGQGDPFDEPEPEALIRELEAALPLRPDLAPRLANELVRRGVRRHEQGEHRLAVGDFRRARAVLTRAEDLAAVGRLEARCRLETASLAVRRGDEALAVHAAGALAEDPAEGREAGYLLGRAHELGRRPEEARASFARALAPFEVPDRLELPTLRELARLAAAGIPADETSPGIGPGWRSIQTPRFTIVHEQGLDGRGLAALVESSREVVRQRIGLRVDERARTAIFVFRTAETYQGSPGARGWSAGHAMRLRTVGEVAPTIYLHAEGDFESRLRHELTHLLVGDALEDAVLPVWVSEGVAVYAETEGSRRLWREQARLLAERGLLRPTVDAVGQMLYPLVESDAEVGRFYIQAAALFEALADRTGVPRALDAARRINTDGPDAALRRAGMSVPALDEAVERLLRR